MVFTINLPWYHGDDIREGANVVADNAEEAVSTWANTLDARGDHDVIPCDAEGQIVFATDENGNVTRVRVRGEMRPQYYTSTVSDEEEV